MTRLGRLENVFATDPIFFVTACTHDRKQILACEEIHSAFLTFCRRSIERRAVVGRYIMMPDHLHLFVAMASEGLNLSDWVKSLKNSMSKALRQAGTPSAHWQKGFFDHVVRSKESYEEKCRYVQENPVRAGLVAKWSEWPFQGEVCRFAL